MAAENVEFVPIRQTKKRRSTGNFDQISPYGSKMCKEHSANGIQLSTAEEIEKVRFENGIEVDKEDCVGPILRFEDLNLQKNILETLSRRSIISPTPVQMQAIPVLMCGKDLIAVAPTGSGKTLGYLIPLLSFLKSRARKDPSQRKPSALIMAPTRELMQQILDRCLDLLQGISDDSISASSRSTMGNQHQGLSIMQINKTVQKYNDMNAPRAMNHFESYGIQYRQNYPHSTPIMSDQLTCEISYNCSHQPRGDYFSMHSGLTSNYKAIGICGGIPIKDHIEMLKNGCDIIIGTPGRMIDLCQRNILSIDEVGFIVLDECDKMLDMGLEEQLRKLFAIIMSTDIPRQTSLWSATLPHSLERLARSSVIDPITIYVGIRDTISKNITQNVVFMHTYLKEKKLLQTLRQTHFPPVLVFASSIVIVDEITKLLKEEEFFAEGLHSKLPQTERFRILSEFRNGSLDVLVATDLASRGLDIPEITHVINYDTPNTIEDYIHRCGRTGRFGRPGQATTFLTLECKIAEELKFLLESTGNPSPLALKDTKQFGKKVLKTEFGDRVL